MRLLSIVWLLVLAFCAPALAESRIVRIEGKNFVTPQGARLDIKGISLGNWLVPEGYMWKFNKAKAPHQIYGGFERLLGPARSAEFWAAFRDAYIQRDDIRFIKSVGFTAVRIPLHYDLFMTDDGVMQGEGWALLDRVLGWVRKEGLYAIVDLHAAPGGQTGVNHDDGTGYPLMFYVPRYRDLTVKLWGAIAKRYAGDPAILGYDLLNEPIAPYHDVNTLNRRLEPFYRQATEAIRAVDPGRVVILAGGQWSSRLDMFGPPFTDNLAYTYHAFWASTKRDAIQRHLNFANFHNVPLFLGEAGELTDDWNEGFRKLHEAHGIGWSFWSYKNLDTPSTVVSIKRPDRWDEIVAFVDGVRAEKPAGETVTPVLAQYLDGLRLENCTVRWSYLASLGLRAAP